MARYIHPKQMEAINTSAIIYVRLNSKDMAMLRFLLEAYDGLALLTIIEPKAALVKILYSSHEETRLALALESVQELIPLAVVENPFV